MKYQRSSTTNRVRPFPLLFEYLPTFLDLACLLNIMSGTYSKFRITVMRTHSKSGWLIAAISFLVLGCVGAVFDTAPHLSESSPGVQVTDWMYAHDLSETLRQLPDLFAVTLEPRCNGGNQAVQYRAFLKPDPHTQLYIWVYDVDEKTYNSYWETYQKQGYSQYTHSYFTCNGRVIHQACFVKNR